MSEQYLDHVRIGVIKISPLRILLLSVLTLSLMPVGLGFPVFSWPVCCCCLMSRLMCECNLFLFFFSFCFLLVSDDFSSDGGYLFFAVFCVVLGYGSGKGNRGGASGSLV